MSQKLIDEIGNKYGFLTPIELTKDKNGRTAWLCKCDCGNTKIVRGSDLRTGRITTCGRNCPLKKERSGYIDETGNIYGYLTVLYRVENSNCNKIMWHCKCLCGRECNVAGTDLRSGNQKSCGCMKSKGEFLILQWLSTHQIEYQKEYKFQELTGYNGGQLRFDFGIFKNNKLTGLIEYQGEQHYYPVKKFGGQESYIQRKYNDQQKYLFCITNKIPILYIYKNDDIDKKLKNFIGEIDK